MTEYETILDNQRKLIEGFNKLIEVLESIRDGSKISIRLEPLDKTNPWAVWLEFLLHGKIQIL